MLFISEIFKDRNRAIHDEALNKKDKSQLKKFKGCYSGFRIFCKLLKFRIFADLERILWSVV